MTSSSLANENQFLSVACAVRCLTVLCLYYYFHCFLKHFADIISRKIEKSKPQHEVWGKQAQEMIYKVYKFFLKEGRELESLHLLSITVLPELKLI